MVIPYRTKPILILCSSTVTAGHFLKGGDKVYPHETGTCVFAAAGFITVKIQKG